MELDFEQGAELGIVLCVNNTLTELNLAVIKTSIYFAWLLSNQPLRIIKLEAEFFIYSKL